MNNQHGLHRRWPGSPAPRPRQAAALVDSPTTRIGLISRIDDNNGKTPVQQAPRALMEGLAKGLSPTAQRTVAQAAVDILPTEVKRDLATDVVQGLDTAKTSRRLSKPCSRD
jgi:phosphatidate phosphatase APP1